MDIKSFMKQIRVPTQEEIEEMLKNSYERSKKNPNNMSYWLPFVSEIGFTIPETQIIDIPFEWFKWLRSDDYATEKIEELTEYLRAEVESKGFSTDREMFIKTGVFSNKFVFRSCKLDNIENIGKQFLEVYYNSALVGASNSSELVIREFIKGKEEKEKIYEGMPLNTEFRVFYDFENKEIMGIFNYWDTEVMLENLRGKDKITFLDNFEKIEEEYEIRKQAVIEEVEKNIGKCELEGQWSMDFMLVDGKIYLIDMAIAKESYYYNKLERR